MTPEQLNGTRLLSGLLVRMVKDSYSDDPLVSDQAHEWMDLHPFEGMASLDRACAQLSAAERAVAASSGIEQGDIRKPSEWLDLSFKACDNYQQLSALENAIELLISKCHSTLYTAYGMSRYGNIRDHSDEDNGPSSPNDHSPSF